MGILMIFAFSLSLAAAAATFQEICLSSHNKLRDLHKDTPAMQWDATLANAAQRWANTLAAGNTFDHDAGRGNVGENLYSATGPKKASCAEAALSWYNEISSYNYADPLDTSKGVVGHFTQLVWKSSIKLGVGVVSYPSGSNVKTVIVARYSPHGNVNTNEAYKANVMERKDPKTKPPSKYDLDPSLCSDAAGKETCTNYNTWGFCNPTNQYYKYMDSYCAKTCKIC